MNRRRTLALVVGSDTELRHEASATLLDRGFAVVTCNGPPGCNLLRGDPCPISACADVAVFMPEDEPTRGGSEGRRLCAADVGRAVAAEPAFWVHHGVEVERADPDAIADAVEALLAPAPSR